jgi:hypothetical protein
MNNQIPNPSDISIEDTDRIFRLFDKTTSCIVLGSGSACDITTCRDLINEWRDESITVFKAGVFDLMHNNHLLFLVHLRLIGASEYCNRHGLDNSDETLLSIACSDKVRVLITIDSDERVNESKSFLHHKSYSPRPTLSWKNRAVMVAHQQMTHNGSGKSLVDAITRHGVNACDSQSCAHQDDTKLALYLQPDIIVLNKDSHKSLDAFKDSSSHIKIVDEKLAFHDELLGGAIKTSNIINRAKKSRTL